MSGANDTPKSMSDDQVDAVRSSLSRWLSKMPYWSQYDDWCRLYPGLASITFLLLGILLSKMVGVLLTEINQLNLPSWLRLALLVYCSWGLWWLMVRIWRRLRRVDMPETDLEIKKTNLKTKKNEDDKEKPIRFNRDKEVEHLSDWLDCSDAHKHILAITGPSGVGKSWLVAELEHYLNRKSPGNNEVIRMSFSSSQSEAIKCMQKIVSFVESDKASGKQVFVILDQFEAYLDWAIDALAEKPKTRNSLRHFMDIEFGKGEELGSLLSQLFHLKENNGALRIVVVVRNDRYYDLRLLGGQGQIPYWAFEVRGISEGVDKPEEAWEDLVEEIKKRVEEKYGPNDLLKNMTEPDGSILPLKAKIVLLMLDIVRTPITDSFPLLDRFPKHNHPMLYNVPTWLASWLKRLVTPSRRKPFLPFMFKGQKISEDQYRGFRGVDGLIEEYFMRVIDSSDTRYTSAVRDVLYVLSVEGRVRTQYSCSDLVKVTCRNNHEIEKAVDHLSSCGIVDSAEDSFKLKHDYFAARFKELSGRFMRPVVRDNLAYAHDAFVLSRKRHVSKKRDPKEELAELTTRSVLQVVKILFVAFFMFRLVNFDIFPSGQEGSWLGIIKYTAYHVDTSWPWDWHYLPICLAQLLWTIYLIELGRKIFARVDEKRSRRVLTGTLMFFVFLGMISTAFVPGFWLAWIGVNALLVGFKFNRLGKVVSRHTSVGNRYSRIGFWTMLHSLPVIVIGLFVYPKFGWDLRKLAGLLNDNLDYFSAFSQLEYSRVFYAVVPLLIYFVFMYKWQASRDSAVEFVGLYNRTRAFEQRPN